MPMKTILDSIGEALSEYNTQVEKKHENESMLEYRNRQMSIEEVRNKMASDDRKMSEEEKVRHNKELEIERQNNIKKSYIGKKTALKMLETDPEFGPNSPEYKSKKAQISEFESQYSFLKGDSISMQPISPPQVGQPVAPIPFGSQNNAPNLISQNPNQVPLR